MTQTISCSDEQKEQLRQIACSTSAGIWRIKRAKIILGTLEGKSVDRLVLDVRVPPLSVIKCINRFAQEEMNLFTTPARNPTPRESSVEHILTFLNHPPNQNSTEWETLTVSYVGISFSVRQIQIIRELIVSKNPSNRNIIAREICNKFELYQPNGAIRLATVLTILNRMEMDNVIFMPQKQKRSPIDGRSTKKGQFIAFSGEEETNHLAINDIRFSLVVNKNDSALWRNIIQQYHYIKTYRMFGPCLRYLVYGKVIKNVPNPTSTAEFKNPDKTEDSDKNCNWWESNQTSGEQLLAVLGFGAGAWQLSSRDEFIGWNNEQRVANLRYVVGNTRFLILPWIKSPNLASRILGGIIRQIPKNWEDRYNYRPILLETFIEMERFTGTCYKAANWIHLGVTKGYSLYGKAQKQNVPSKSVYVYPLKKFSRALLCSTGGCQRGKTGVLTL
jgi:hypothetical protein